VTATDAGAAAAGAHAGPFVPADVLRLRFVGDAGLVPGTSLGWCVVSAVDAGRMRDVSTLWRFDREGGEHREIVGPFADPRAAVASSDGARLAFVADVDGVAQLWACALADGAVELLTDLPQGVAGAPAWAPDGTAIAFTGPPSSRRDPSAPYRLDRWPIRYEGVGSIEDALQDVFLLELATRGVRRLTDGRAIDDGPRFSPDGRRLLFRRSFAPDRPWEGKPSLWVLELASGTARELVGAWGGVLAAEWCHGGARIALQGVRARPGFPEVHFSKHDVWTVDLDGGEPVCRTTSLPAGVGTWLEFDHPTWAVDAQPRLRVDAAGVAAFVQAQRGCDMGVCRVALDGAEDVAFLLEPSGHACFLRDAGADGTLLYTRSSPVDPPELFVRDGAGERRVTGLGAEPMRARPRPRVAPLEVTAPDGVRLEGRALTPPGEGPFPTVLCIHGGPSDAYGSPFMIDWQLLVGAGFAVVFSNFRGSGGYGDDFHVALGDRWGEVGELDHLATVDRAIELGVADPERLGVYGLSHGGFAVCWLLGRSDRFRAGVAENPLVDFASAYATMDDPWWMPLVLGATPDEDPGGYAERSPLAYAAACTTPLLFVAGEEDQRCDPTQAEQFYRALKRAGCPTELLRLPGAGHTGSWNGPPRARHAQDVALVDWFARHLQPRTP